jgi:hypothetical protein
VISSGVGRVAPQADRAQTEIAQPGQGAGAVVGVDEHADAAGARGGSAGQVEGHDHGAVRQLAETSCGHAVTSPFRSVSMTEPQRAPEHDRRQPARGLPPIRV